MVEQITHLSFLNHLLQTPVFFIPQNNDDIEYWKKVLPLMKFMHIFYSVKADNVVWLSDILNQHYESFDQKINQTTDITQTELENKIDELTSIYQILDAAFSTSRNKIPNSVKDHDLFQEIRSFQDDSPFCEYLKDTVERGKHTIDDWIRKFQNSKQRLTQRDYDNIKESIRNLSTYNQKTKDEIEQTKQNIEKTERELTERLNSLISKSEQTLKNAEDRATELAGEAKKHADNAKKQVDNVLPNILTILGIFVAIIVAFVSGFFSLVLADQNISNIPQICLAHFLLMGHVLTNILFLLMFMIARLSEKNVSIACMNDDLTENPATCRDCSIRCNWYFRIWNRYPFVFLANYFFLGGYLIMFAWWYIDIFLYQYIYNYLIDHLLASVITLFVAFVVIFLVIYKFYTMVHKK